MGQTGDSEPLQKWILLLKPESFLTSFPQLPGIWEGLGEMPPHPRPQGRTLHGAVLITSVLTGPQQMLPIATSAGT